MNLSGQAVGELARYFKIDPADALAVDEVQLPLGRLRFRARGSAGGHNGLRSIEAHLERTSIRGCASASGEAMDADLGDHVLARFEPDERVVIDEAVSRAADAMEAFIDAGIEVVDRTGHNRKEDKEDKEEQEQV